MVVIRKIDDTGRIAIPKDIRRSLRWMGGDEIELKLQQDNSLILKKAEQKTAAPLYDMRQTWTNDEEISKRLDELIELIEEKSE